MVSQRPLEAQRATHQPENCPRWEAGWFKLGFPGATVKDGVRLQAQHTVRTTWLSKTIQRLIKIKYLARL